MAVKEVQPFIEYIGNGVTTSFSFDFNLGDQSSLTITINDDVLDDGWTIEDQKVIFNNPPEANANIKILRTTQLKRDTDFQTYDDSFSPQALNEDLDRIWYVLQEQNLNVTRFNIDYSYSVSTANNSFKIANSAADKALEAYNLAKETNIEIRPIERGGTGADNVQSVRDNLEIYSKDETLSLVQTGGQGTIVGISSGGTGATNSEEARENLNLYSKEEVNFLAFPLGVPLFHIGSRSTIEDGYIPLDGQLLYRADFPTLWNKIQKSFTVISDSDWLSSPLNRGCYSSGDGSVTFRMPDLNGCVEDSLKGLFLRGDGGGSIGGQFVSSGTVLSDAIRNIIGQTAGQSTAKVPTSVYTGAFSATSYNVGNISTGENLGVIGSTFDASRVVPTANENRPVSVVGIWICRVSGGTSIEHVEKTDLPTLVGGNIWNGGQTVQGDFNVLGSFNADIKPLLNANGKAPISACRAWASISINSGVVSILQSFNVLSIVKVSSGLLKMNFIEPMPHKYYVLFGTAAPDSGGADQHTYTIKSPKTDQNTVDSIYISTCYSAGNATGVIDVLRASFGVIC